MTKVIIGTEVMYFEDTLNACIKKYLNDYDIFDIKFNAENDKEAQALLTALVIFKPKSDKK